MISFRRVFSSSSAAAGAASPAVFSKVLVANRGEIACRVMRTLKRLGIRTVAVYSEADANSMHVGLADEAFCIGPPPSKQSYLLGDVILAAARKSGAQAVHPGYGFLSENEDFARACEAAKIAFIGPPPSAIRAMGSKSEAKKIMISAGVPCVPGYHGDDQSPALLQREAEKIGFPVLIKAVMGGGGKGMKIANSSAEFPEALESAKRESMNSFKDDRVILEKYIVKSRHVEVQVFGDKHGDAVHLFERDCSVQRRHQKIIEEAPAPGLDPALKKRFGEAAVAAAKAVGYVGAGTVEFILDVTTNKFYFMEMNTRLQVEHPVTEMITGQDLVDWQVQVAAGHRIPLNQSQIQSNGHAFEARVYAENTEANFLPATGTLHHLAVPATGPHVRIDTGVREKDSVSIYYDPMIAKLIVWGENRDIAIRRLRDALADFRIVGLPNNVAFLHRLASHQRFGGTAQQIDVHSGFIADHGQDLLAPTGVEKSNRALALGALYSLLAARSTATAARSTSNDPFSPWGAGNGFRSMQAHLPVTSGFSFNGLTVTARSVAGSENSWDLTFPDKTTMRATGSLGANGDLAADLAGERSTVHVVSEDRRIHVFERDTRYVLVTNTPDYVSIEHGGALSSGTVMSDMPGNVVKVLVKPGDTVTKGQALLILEAMKMELTFRAPVAGKVKAVHATQGKLVKERTPLVVIE